jgi:hypothetical protein
LTLEYLWIGLREVEESQLNSFFLMYVYHVRKLESCELLRIGPAISLNSKRFLAGQRALLALKVSLGLTLRPRQDMK